MRKFAPRFREATRNGSGIVPRGITKTKNRAWRAGLGVLLTLSVSGCLGKIFSDDVSYEVQVRDGRGPVEGARVRARAPELRDAPVEGITDTGGRCALAFEMPTLLFRHRSSELHLPWVEVAVEKDGYEPLAVPLDRSQFIEEGRGLRRAEAVVLRKKQP